MISLVAALNLLVEAVPVSTAERSLNAANTSAYVGAAYVPDFDKLHCCQQACRGRFFFCAVARLAGWLASGWREGRLAGRRRERVFRLWGRVSDSS